VFVCQMDEVDSIHVATERLMGSMGDTPEMVRQARILALVCFNMEHFFSSFCTFHMIILHFYIDEMLIFQCFNAVGSVTGRVVDMLQTIPKDCSLPPSRA